MKRCTKDLEEEIERLTADLKFRTSERDVLVEINHTQKAEIERLTARLADAGAYTLSEQWIQQQAEIERLRTRDEMADEHVGELKREIERLKEINEAQAAQLGDAYEDAARLRAALRVIEDADPWENVARVKRIARAALERDPLASLERKLQDRIQEP